MSGGKGLISSCFQRMALEVYLLPRSPWEEVNTLQQRLVYELSGAPRRRAALILCEHDPIITVGGGGSRSHLRIDEDELGAAGVELRWTNRGGGCWHHLPGQLAVYPIVPLDPLGFGLERHRAAMYQTLIDALEEFHIAAERDRIRSGLVVGDREIGMVGFAVRNWVAYHGAWLNVNVPLDRCDWVRSNPAVDRRATSIFRELRLPARVEAVREAVIRHVVRVFGFRDHFLCDPPPAISLTRRANASARNH